MKSPAVGKDHALYVSVGSTGNASAEDLEAKPQRATVLRVAQGKRTATVFARGVRNGTGLAVAPDGRCGPRWTTGTTSASRTTATSTATGGTTTGAG